MPDHDRVGLHRIQRHRRVDQRFPFFDAGLRSVHIDHIGAHPFAGNFKGQQRPRAVLEKGIDHGQTVEPVGMFAGFLVEIDPLSGFLQQEQYLPGLQPGDTQ